MVNGSRIRRNGAFFVVVVMRCISNHSKNTSKVRLPRRRWTKCTKRKKCAVDDDGRQFTYAQCVVRSNVPSLNFLLIHAFYTRGARGLAHESAKVIVYGVIGWSEVKYYFERFRNEFFVEYTPALNFEHSPLAKQCSSSASASWWPTLLWLSLAISMMLARVLWLRPPIELTHMNHFHFYLLQQLMASTPMSLI